MRHPKWGEGRSLSILLSLIAGFPALIVAAVLVVAGCRKVPTEAGPVGATTSGPVVEVPHKHEEWEKKCRAKITEGIGHLDSTKGKALQVSKSDLSKARECFGYFMFDLPPRDELSNSQIEMMLEALTRMLAVETRLGLPSDNTIRLQEEGRKLRKWNIEEFQKWESPIMKDTLGRIPLY